MKRLFCAFALSLILCLPSLASNEIQATAPTGRTLYAEVISSVGDATNGKVWQSGNTFATLTNTSLVAQSIPLTEAGTTGIYLASFPTTITAPGSYLVLIYTRAGGSPAVGDSLTGSGSVDWTGTALSSVAKVQPKTDLLAFDGSGYVNSHAKINDDKTGYTATASNLPTDYQQRSVAVTLPTTPPSGYGSSGSGPTAVQIRQEMDANSTKLAVLPASFPPNFSTLLIGTGSDAGKVTTANPSTTGSGSSVTEASIWAYSNRSVTDKAGFSLATAPPTVAQIVTGVFGHVTPSGRTFDRDQAINACKNSGKYTSSAINLSTHQRTLDFYLADGTTVGVHTVVTYDSSNTRELSRLDTYPGIP